MKLTDHHLSTNRNLKVDLDYLLYVPKTLPAGADNHPLMLFLHGMGERGSNLAQVKMHGPPARIEQGAELPFIVAAPQCPLGAVWQTESLLALLHELSEQLPVDRSRVYLTGLSMGGAGTWALANARPEMFAAIVPICGPYTMVDPVNFLSTPVWCFHGAMDSAVPVEHSLKMVRALRQHGADVRLTIYPDADHDSWTETYANPELYDWLLEHRRPIVQRE